MELRDYYGRDASVLAEKKLWLFDMDGTIYQEERLFDGTLDLLAAIRAGGGRYVFITNNSSRSVSSYLEKLDRLGVPATAEDFCTSVEATILYLRQNHPGARVYCQATRSMIAELRAAGITVTEQVEPVDVVLLGFDTELTSQKLRNTCEILTTQNTAYLATNPDLVCPVSFGYIPDCGSISIMLKNATGKYPKFIGKPEPTMINVVRERYGISAAQTVVLGDRIYTDIAAGWNAGVTTVFVLSGEGTLEDAAAAATPPTFVFGSVKDLAAL